MGIDDFLIQLVKYLSLSQAMALAITWLLGICAWIGGDTSLRIEGKVAAPDSSPDHYNVKLGRDSTPTLPVFLISWA